MWRSSRKKARSKHTTLIAQGTVVDGNVRFEGSLEIEGTVSGNVISAEDSDLSFVRVMESGRVRGEIKAPTVVINGAVNGDVYASEYMELAAKAVVDGDVHYQLLEMVKGAQVNGGLVHHQEEMKPSRDGVKQPEVRATLEKITQVSSLGSS